MSKNKNFGLQSRDVTKAGGLLLRAAADVSRKDIGQESVSALDGRFGAFARYARAEHGIKDMQSMTRELAIEYGQLVAAQVRAGERKASYGQALVSAVNSVLSRANPEWVTVKPVADCGCPERDNVRKVAPTGLDRHAVQVAAAANLTPHAQAFVGLARAFGLRTKEVSLLECRAALRDALKGEAITVRYGTKGKFTRLVPITNDGQVDALRAAVALIEIDKTRNLIPSAKSWAQYQNGQLQKTRDSAKKIGIDKLHDLRAAFACERYQQLTGCLAPVIAGKIEDRAADLAARKIISIEMGHKRTDVLSRYIGGRRL